MSWRIKRRMVLGSRSHVISHDIHKIDGRQDSLEVNVTGRSYGGKCQFLFIADGSSDILHQKCKILRIVRWRGYICHRAGGIFPIDVNAIQSELLHHTVTVRGKSTAIFIIGSHLTETSASPATDGKQHFQLRLLFPQINNLSQTFLIINLDTVKALVYMTERIVDMRHVLRVGHHLTPRSDISNHNLWIAGSRNDLFSRLNATAWNQYAQSGSHHHSNFFHKYYL